MLARAVINRLRQVVLDDEEGGQLELGGRLSHLANDVLIARVDDALASHCLPLERS